MQALVNDSAVVEYFVEASSKLVSAVSKIKIGLRSASEGKGKQKIRTEENCKGCNLKGQEAVTVAITFKDLLEIPHCPQCP